VSLDELVVVLKLVQGRHRLLAHDWTSDWCRAVPHVGRPSVLLPESLEAYGVLRAPSAPDSTGLSRVCAPGGMGA
jgi:hypothetical protein